MSTPTQPDSTPLLTNKTASMAKAATIISVGNIASRLLGLVREIVIATLFGATGQVSAFRIAQTIPTMLYDLLIGGMVSSALVPVFSEQADHNRKELWHLVSLILSLATIVLAITVIIIELAAPQIANFMAVGLSPELLDIATSLMRITTLAVLFLGLSGVVTGLLHALKRFTLPAFTAATFNTTLIIVAWGGVTLFGWGIETLAIGLLAGAFFQLVLQLPALHDARFRFVINLYHPVLRRIGKLYLPIILGLVISQIAILLDRRFASLTGEESIAWMQYATTVIQFPLGLISAAIALAILPTLSRQASSTEANIQLHEFMDTLVAGLRLVLILIIPATVALFILAEPVITLLFEHGNFTPYDTQQTALALRFYLFGLTFAAIDQPLIFAFYARQNTLTPALVGLLAVGFYLVAALLPTLFRPMQMTDLVLANSVQLTGHALVMLWLANKIAPIYGRRLGSTTLKAMLGATVMGLVLWAMVPSLNQLLPGDNFITQAITVGLLIALGGGVYLLTLAPLKITELSLLTGLVKRFLPK